VDSVSYFGSIEEEILFSMHTVFRIGEMEQLENDILQVKLTSTNDDDPQLRILTEHIEKEELSKGDGVGWDRLSCLMIQLSEFDRAEDFYRKLYNSNSHIDSTYIVLQLNLGNVKYFQGNYKKAGNFSFLRDPLIMFKSPDE